MTVQVQQEEWARPSAQALREMVDVGRGRISPRIFWDEAIYRLELERIFARCWIFVAHESQIPNPGDFLTTTIGEDGVIVSRANDGQVKVLLNACPHRGNRVCFAEAGNARRFTCNYHGWAFGRDGAFLGMPAEEIYEKTCPDSTSRSWA